MDGPMAKGVSICLSVCLSILLAANFPPYIVPDSPLARLAGFFPENINLEVVIILILFLLLFSRLRS